MKLTPTHHDDHIRVMLEGELDAKTSPPTTEALLDVLREGGSQRLVLDFAGVSFMSSPGLRMLLEVYKRGKAGGITLEVVNPQPGVAKVMRLAGFDTLLLLNDEGN
jgi:anti-sigma B factor antagonist